MPTKERERLHLQEFYDDLSIRTAQIQALEEKYRVQMDESPYCIITIDEDSIIRYANTSTEQLFGYKAEEIIGKNLIMLMPEAYRRKHLERLQDYLETRKKSVNWDDVKLIGRKKDGTHVPMIAAYSEFIKPDGKYFTAIIKKDESSQ